MEQITILYGNTQPISFEVEDVGEVKTALNGVMLLYPRLDADITTSYISVPNIPLAKAYSSANQVPFRSLVMRTQMLSTLTESRDRRGWQRDGAIW